MPGQPIFLRGCDGVIIKAMTIAGNVNIGRVAEAGSQKRVAVGK